MSALKQQWTDLAQIEGPEGRPDMQFGWQVWAGSRFRKSQILDVGAGLGQSRERLQAFENIVTLQDVAPV